MTPLPRELIRRQTEIPPAFRAAFEEEVQRFAITAVGAQIRIGLDNSLAMSSYVTRVGGELVIVVDWARIERLLMFSSFFWKRLRGPLFHQHLVSYLEREICLLAARKAAALRALVSARDYHRAYRLHAFAAELASSFDLDEHTRDAVLFGRALVQEQLAKGMLTSDPSAAYVHFRAMAAHDRLRPIADDRLRTHLFIDSFVVDELTRIDPEGSAQGLLPSMALATAYSEIEDAVDAIAPGFDGFAEPLDQRMEAERRRDHRARLGQLEDNIRSVCDEQEDASFGEFLARTADVAALLSRIVRDVFANGLEVLHTHFWDNPHNVKRANAEVVQGLEPAAEAAILEALCSHDADNGHGRWEEVERMQTVAPSPADDLIPAFVALPGSGRPVVDNWQSRLSDPALRSKLERIGLPGV